MPETVTAGTLAAVCSVLLGTVGGTFKVLHKLITSLVSWIQSKDKKITELSKDLSDANQKLGRAEGTYESISILLNETNREIELLVKMNSQLEVEVAALKEKLKSTLARIKQLNDDTL